MSRKFCNHLQGTFDSVINATFWIAQTTGSIGKVVSWKIQCKWLIRHPYSMWYRFWTKSIFFSRYHFKESSTGSMFYIYVRSAFSRHNSCKMDVKSNNCEKSIKVQIKWIQISLLKYKILKDSHVGTPFLYLSRFNNTWNIPFWLEFAKNEVKWHDVVS